MESQDGEQQLEREALGWIGQNVYVRPPDPRYRFTAVGLDAADVRRRGYARGHQGADAGEGQLSVMTIFLLIAVIVGLAVAATFMARWVDNDGGPRRPRRPRAKDSWSTDRPTRPYATL
jgi:hypothetical protein